MTWQDFKTQYLVRFWAPVPAVIAAGVLSAYYFGITGTFWAVTGEFTRWGGHALQLFGFHPETWGYFKVIHLEGTPLDRVDGMMIIGMFAGCLSAALWANNVKLRMPHHRVRIVQAVLGGLIAGFGARLAMGCNLAAFFTGIPQFSLHAWLFALATASGSWFGARVTMLPVFRIPVKLQKVSAPQPLQQREEGAASFPPGHADFRRLHAVGAGPHLLHAQAGAGGLVRPGFRSDHRARAGVLHLGLPRSVADRPHSDGQGHHRRHGGERDWRVQLCAAGRAAQDTVGRPECGDRRGLVRLRHRAGRRLRNRLDVSRGGGPGALLVGGAGQYRRRHLAGGVVGRYRAGGGNRLRQGQSAGGVWPARRPGAHLRDVGAGDAGGDVVGKTLFANKARAARFSKEAA